LVFVVCISFLTRVPLQVCAQHCASRLTRGQRLVITLWDRTHCNDRVQVLRNDTTLHYGMVPPIPRYDVESVWASWYLVTTRCYNVSLLVILLWRRSLRLLMPGYDVALRNGTPGTSLWRSPVWVYWYLVTTQ